MTELSPAERYAAARARAARDRSQLGAFVATMDFDLDPFQIEACEALETGRGVLVAAPTGAGKTVVGEFAVHLALAQGRKAFYTTPIKALSNQKYGDLARRYGAEKVGLLTGDTSINGDAQVVVMTTEVLRNMLYAGSQALDGLGFVIMDEVHYLADRFRGPVWEEVIIHLSDDVQLVSLSATVSNAEEFGDWLEMVRGDTAVVVSEHRPVPLWQHVMTGASDGVDMHDLYAGHVDPTAPGTNPPINPDLALALRRSAPTFGRGGGRGGGRGSRDQDRTRGGRPQRAVHRASRLAVVDALDADGLLPAIYFIFSRSGCEGALSACLASGLRLTSPAQADEIRAFVEERCSTIPPSDLGVLGYVTWLEGLTRGFAAHHAGMLPLFKETVEQLFARGLIKVVFATETLALGINMPARTVVLEKLVKWDGRTHADMTPGEYTQLTGRAGRRGIDIEGHAVVVEHPGLDPVALAGLASRRLYPLRSSFRPTYNMAVNLVGQVGRVRSREVLETSFAQFQADRGVVGLAKQAQTHAEALAGYAEAMTCDRGDFSEYAALRRKISAREQDLSRKDAGRRRAQVAESLANLRRGDVLLVPAGRRPGHAVVIDQGAIQEFDGPRPTVLMVDRQVRRLSATELTAPVEVVARIRIPKGFNARQPASRRDLAASVRAELGAFVDDGAGRRGKGRASGADDPELAQLRRELKAHPCHGCPDREAHARWGERWSKLDQEHRALLRRISGRTGTIARSFDHICDVLTTLGYLAPYPDGDAADDLDVTTHGQTLQRLYAENDLLLAECLRRGAWKGLEPAALAAVVSTVVYSARRESHEAEPHLPGGPHGPLARALDETVRIWSELDDLESSHRLDATSELDLGLVEPIHRWASGRPLDAVLRSSELAAGDFVRWCKQVIDVLDQISGAAPDAAMRQTAERGVRALRRGVVAYSSV